MIAQVSDFNNCRIMNVFVDGNMPDAGEKGMAVGVAVRMAEALEKADLVELEGLVAEECVLVTRGKGSRKGKEAVVSYLKGWLEAFGERVYLKVKWLPYSGSPGILLKPVEREGESVILLRVEAGKIANIAFATSDFKSPPFFYNELPFNIEFVKANAPKMAEPLENQLFCPRCGAPSEVLSWREGVVYQVRRGVKCGALSFFSYCERCKRVVEMARNRKWKYVLTLTPEQEERALRTLTLEQRAEYMDGSFGNKKPKKDFKLDSKTNELGEFGEKFFGFVESEIIGNGKNPSITCRPSIESAWQVYLLSRAENMLPTFWHGAYRSKMLIFNEAAVNDIKPLRIYDTSALSENNLLLPEVTLSEDGKAADVRCTYWNDWQGLVREHVRVHFHYDGRVEVEEREGWVLVEYNCGIQL